jgi:hypothetical protein
MWGQPPSAVHGAKRRPASVERTLLSVAFDVDLDVDVDLRVPTPALPNNAILPNNSAACPITHPSGKRLSHPN